MASAEYYRAWKKARKDDWMRGKLCVDCGGQECLEIHHEDPSLKYGAGVRWGRAWVDLQRELEVCVVVCRDCHFIRHYGHPPQEHGLHRYNQGCRCAQCRGAKREYDRKSRKRCRERRASGVSRSRGEKSL